MKLLLVGAETPLGFRIISGKIDEREELLKRLAAFECSRAEGRVAVLVDCEVVARS